MNIPIAHNYTTITETPGVAATTEQLSMLYTRYKLAAEHCRNKDVLEVACGAGQGLGYLNQWARTVVGIDIDKINLKFAMNHYEGRRGIQLGIVDAHDLPFKPNSFDVIVSFEVIYYLSKPDRFIEECHKILRKNGKLIICTVNKEWTDFNPSPFSTGYLTGNELSRLLQANHFETELYGGFHADQVSLKNKIISILKRKAVSLNLIPKSMKGKELLKRVIWGKLTNLPSEVTTGMAAYMKPEKLDSEISCSNYKVLYAIAQAQ